MALRLVPSIACFTGPRPSQLYGYEDVSRGRYKAIVAYMEQVVAVAYNDGYDTFISGGAQGFDQLAFWSVEKVKEENSAIGNILYLPFEQQDRIWRSEGLFGQKEYQKMKGMADAFIYTTDGIVSERYEIIKALHTRNHRMVDDSSLVIALLAGRSRDWQTSKGGTAECVRYAMSRGKQVLAITFDEQNTCDFESNFLN